MSGEIIIARKKNPSETRKKSRARTKRHIYSCGFMNMIICEVHVQAMNDCDGCDFIGLSRDTVGRG